MIVFQANRIVNGEETGVHEFPWHIGLKLKPSFLDSQAPFCGGTLIGLRCVLTAAHCLEKVQPEWIEVVIGEHDWSMLDETNRTEVLEVESFVMHPEYNQNYSNLFMLK